MKIETSFDSFCHTKDNLLRFTDWRRRKGYEAAQHAARGNWENMLECIEDGGDPNIPCIFHVKITPHQGPLKYEKVQASIGYLAHREALEKLIELGLNVITPVTIEEFVGGAFKKKEETCLILHRSYCGGPDAEELRRMTRHAHPSPQDLPLPQRESYVARALFHHMTAIAEYFLADNMPEESLGRIYAGIAEGDSARLLGETPYHLANIHLLMKHGLVPDQPCNARGETPLTIARRLKLARTFNILGKIPETDLETTPKKLPLPANKK